jgi:predicted dinucleotide-binding enzyme
MIGGTLAGMLAALGHEVALANSRGPLSLRGFADRHPGVVPASVPEAAAHAELAVLAIPFGRYAELPAQAFSGRIVIDSTNYYPGRDGRFPTVDSGETSSSQLIADHLPGTRVVKAFNTIYYRQLATDRQPDAPPDRRRAIPIAGDDRDAKESVASLISQLGFTPVDTGSLSGSVHLQPGSPLFNVAATEAQARQLLGLARPANPAAGDTR